MFEVSRDTSRVTCVLEELWQSSDKDPWTCSLLPSADGESIYRRLPKSVNQRTSRDSPKTP